MKQTARSAAVAVTILTLAGCTGSKIQEGVPKNAVPKPPMEMPSMAPQSKGESPLSGYNKVMSGGGTTPKADAKGS